jgi:hypothetical protein
MPFNVKHSFTVVTYDVADLTICFEQTVDQLANCQIIN